MSIQPDDQHERNEHLETPPPTRRDCTPPGWWWAVSALLILVSIINGTLFAPWLSRWLVAPAGKLPPHVVPSPSPVVPALLPWDSRSCAASPSPLTCDGRLALLPEDMQNFAHPQGGGACFDRDSTSVTQNIVAIGSKTNEILGKLSLWWFPRCQSHAAQIFLQGDGRAARLSVELHVLHSGTGPWGADESYTAIYTTGTHIASSAWTVLIWSPAAAYDVLACGRINWQGQTGQLCTPRLA